MNIADIQAINYWVEHNRDKELEIYIAGRVLGGKPGEVPLRPKNCKAVGDSVVIYFSETERLWVKKPENVTVTGISLVIGTAEVVSWGWHYYGRQQTGLNWCEHIYHIDGKDVIFCDRHPLDCLLPFKIEKFEYSRGNLVSIGSVYRAES